MLNFIISHAVRTLKSAYNYVKSVILLLFMWRNSHCLCQDDTFRRFAGKPKRRNETSYSKQQQSVNLWMKLRSWCNRKRASRVLHQPRMTNSSGKLQFPTNYIEISYRFSIPMKWCLSCSLFIRSVCKLGAAEGGLKWLAAYTVLGNYDTG